MTRQQRPTGPHPTTDCCWWCATEDEIVAALKDQPTKTLWRTGGQTGCPFMAIDDAPDREVA